MKMMVNGVVVEVDDKEYLEEYGETPKEVIIDDLKQKLAETDYQSLKHHEGELTDEEFEPIRLQRKVWRDEINRLEKENE